MKNKEDILDNECNKYGGFVNVITKCGGTLVSQIWLRTMQEYADQQTKELREEIDRLKESNKEIPLDKMTVEQLNEAWDYHGKKMDDAWNEVKRRNTCNHFYRSSGIGKMKCIKCGNNK